MWSLLGHYDRTARNSSFGYVLAIIVAMETFNSSGHRYKTWMCYLIIASGIYIAKKAFSTKSILGIATSVFSLIWLAPLLDSNFFYNIDLNFMLAHSALSLAVATGAFTFLKS